MKTVHIRVIVSLVLAATLFGTVVCLAQEAKPHQDGPTSILIFYKCHPAKRSALRRYMMSEGLARFAQWKNQGVLSDYHILFSRYVDTANWDMMAILSFRHYSDVSGWNEIERTSPAGLGSEALADVSAVHTYPSDLIRMKSSPQAASHAVYFVIPYKYSVDTDEYVTYLDGYVIPQLNGWLAANTLSMYGVYLDRYEASRPWGSLLLLQYRDNAALGHRESTVAKVRSQLVHDPAWTKWSEDKHNIRVEGVAVIADELH